MKLRCEKRRQGHRWDILSIHRADTWILFDESLRTFGISFSFTAFTRLSTFSTSGYELVCRGLVNYTDDMSFFSFYFGSFPDWVSWDSSSTGTFLDDRMLILLQFPSPPFSPGLPRPSCSWSKQSPQWIGVERYGIVLVKTWCRHPFLMGWEAKALYYCRVGHGNESPQLRDWNRRKTVGIVIPTIEGANVCGRPRLPSLSPTHLHRAGAIIVEPKDANEARKPCNDRGLPIFTEWEGRKFSLPKGLLICKRRDSFDQFDERAGNTPSSCLWVVRAPER